MPDYRLATERAARKHGVDPAVLKALIQQESGFREGVKSGAGAQDIAQFMPATAKAYGVTLGDGRVSDDLDGAARYIADNLKKTGGNYHQALSIYNSGKPDAYKDPSFAGGQTYNYVRSIMANAKRDGGTPSKASTPSSSRSTTRTTTPGVDNSVARSAAIAQFLGDKRADPVTFAMQVRGLRDTPATTVQAPTKPYSEAIGTPGGSGRTPTGQRGKIIGTPNQGKHTLGNWQSDNAVDIAVPVGTPMVALQDGVIVKVRRHPQGAGRFAGDQITVKGANGNEYFYAHGKARVKPGQRIRKGQSLGTTGSANGVAHLHFGQERGDPRMHTH
jgi:murein DD-endopeptidase MepM/ murein hydrolase activator NlpD